VVRTNERGHAAFVTDSPGTWRLEATDTEGHVATVSIEVMEDGVVAPPSSWRRWLLRGSLPAKLILLGLLLHLGYARGRSHGCHSHHNHNHNHNQDHVHSHDHPHS